MLNFRLKYVVLLLCVLDTVVLLTAQVLGNENLLWICLIAFFMLAGFAAIKKMSVPVFLFFLPFSPLLKLQPGTISLFTITLLVVYALYLLNSGKRIFIFHFFPGILLLSLALIIKTAYSYDISNRFIMFFVAIFCVPFVIREIKNYDFFWLSLFFSLGIIIAAISSQYLAIFPTIRRYITIYDIAGILRKSGYYGDPNFYSAHITAALSGVLILLLHTNQKGRMIFLALIAALLVYCGFLSVSKSFVLILLFLLLFAAVEFMLKRGKISSKLTIMIAFVLCTVFLLSSTVFSDNLDMMFQRLTTGYGLSDFTTGRIDIWNDYFIAFDENPLLLIFGNGLTNTIIGDKATHNTIIQCLFQFGIVGSALLIIWCVIFIRWMLSGVQYEWKIFISIVILLMGAFGPWMALDLLFFDEFFLMPIYVCVGIHFLNENTKRNGLSEINKV